MQQMSHNEKMWLIDKKSIHGGNNILKRNVIRQLKLHNTRYKPRISDKWYYKVLGS
jgi:hypothetical protein